MSNTLSDNDLIERFILGKLSDPEIRQFNERLADDREFARKYRLITTFPEMMSDAGRAEMESKKTVTEPPPKKEKPPRLPRKERRWLPRLIIVIVSLALIVILFFLVWPRSGDNREKIIPQAVQETPKKDSVKETAPSSRDTTKPVQPATTMSEVPTMPPNPVTENQKAAPSGNGLRLLTPAEGAKFLRTDTLHFSWIFPADTFARFCIVADFSGEVVLWRGVRPGVKAVKVPANYLLPGKFYWYVGIKETRRSFTISD